MLFILTKCTSAVSAKRSGNRKLMDDNISSTDKSIIDDIVGNVVFSDVLNVTR